jgi:outer membrane protein TolC
MRFKRPNHGFPAIALFAIAGCAGSLEDSTRTSWDEAARERAEAEPAEAGEPDGSLEWYVTRALATSPEMNAAFARWRRAVLGISRARRLPDPTISYAYFVRSVETRVGPQRHRLSLRQAFPWPTQLSAGGESAALEAQAEERRFEALALALRERVARAYWELWRVRRTHQAQLEQDDVLDGIAASVRGRVEVGGASLADLSQLQLRIERHHDHRDLHRERARTAAAELRGVVGLAPGTPVPTTAESPATRAIAEDPDALYAAVRRHPSITAVDSLARSSEEAADSEDAARLPTFALGVDWIETGDAAMSGVEDSGKDPLIVSVSMSVPLWQGSYSDASDAHRARAIERRAEGEAAIRRAEAALEAALSHLRDTERRVRLHERTLVPQAEAVYSSVLGAYHTGASSIAQLLLSVQDLLELQVQLVEARADHAVAWAHAEQLVGRPLRARAAGEVSDE